MVPVVDLSQIGENLGGQFGERGEEALVARFRGEAFECRDEQRPVVGDDRSQCDRLTVAQL
jgi:hypothetical protein